MPLSRSFATLGVALCAAIAAGACSSPSTSTTPPEALTQRPASNAPMPQPLTFEVAPDLPRVPGNIDFAARPAAEVRSAYLFAARHPEVLKYVPCFCGCERGGHKGNHDCFVGTRDAAGKPVQWDTHGMVCEICIDVANDAKKMHASGATITAIQAAIDQRYAAGRPRTPTPRPPHGSGSPHPGSHQDP